MNARTSEGHASAVRICAEVSDVKFTPGPWRITGQSTKYIEASIGNGLVQEVASVGPTDADNGYGEQQDANACLISAAPDLLAALEEIVEYMQSAGFDWSLDKARSAIAKAVKP